MAGGIHGAAADGKVRVIMEVAEKRLQIAPGVGDLLAGEAGGYQVFGLSQRKFRGRHLERLGLERLGGGSIRQGEGRHIYSKPADECLRLPVAFARHFIELNRRERASRAKRERHRLPAPGVVEQLRRLGPRGAAVAPEHGRPPIVLRDGLPRAQPQPSGRVKGNAGPQQHPLRGGEGVVHPLGSAQQAAIQLRHSQALLIHGVEFHLRVALNLESDPDLVFPGSEGGVPGDAGLGGEDTSF
jgi:hypothetical protein